MFKHGDDIYILDNGRWNSKNEILIIKRTFERYFNEEKTYLEFSGESSLTIASWAVSKNIEDATKFAVAYLITTQELKENMENVDFEDIEKINFQERYKELEKSRADLIFKYMDKVKEA